MMQCIRPVLPLGSYNMGIFSCSFLQIVFHAVLLLDLFFRLSILRKTVVLPLDAKVESGRTVRLD